MVVHVLKQILNIISLLNKSNKKKKKRGKNNHSELRKGEFFCLV